MKRSPAGCPQGWERIWAAGPALTKYWDEPEPAVVEWARGLGPSVRRVLDLGCGVGRHTVLFSRLGPRAVGVDVSPSALAMCVAKMREQGLDPTLVRNDMAWLPFGDGAHQAELRVEKLHLAVDQTEEVDLVDLVTGTVRLE